MKTTSRFNEKNYHAAGDLNRNATKTQAEHQRDACEDELYRLRYGIERLLVNKDQGDSQRQSRNAYGHSPLGRMKSHMSNWISWRKKSWFERCTPCCRRKRHENSNIPNQYPSQHDPNDDSTSQMSSYSAPQTPLHNDPFVSPSPSTISSTPQMGDHTKGDRNQSIPDINDPAYQSSILKILEAKALDCLCAGYSRDNTQKQISQALSDINHRADTPRHSSSSHHSRSSSSKRRRKKKPSKSRSRTSHSRGRKRSSSKSRTKKRSSSKHGRRSSSKHGRRPSSSHHKKGSSKHRKKSSSKHRKHSSSTHRKKSKRKPSSSRSHRSKHSSKSHSHKSKHKHKHHHHHKHKKKKGRRKHSKAKSNNQTNEFEVIQSKIRSPLYQPIYRNRQKLLQLLLSST